MAEKRIVCFEVSGECRYFRDVKEQFFDVPPGTYCAACLHSGWESIDPSACKTCKREKSFEGKTRDEIKTRMAKAICLEDEHNACEKELCDECEGWKTCLGYAEVALNAILQEK